MFKASAIRGSRHQILGDPSEEDPPVPIPNTEVKLLSPDGTAQATVWESRKSPGLNFFIFRRGAALRRSRPTPRHDETCATSAAGPRSRGEWPQSGGPAR